VADAMEEVAQVIHQLKHPSPMVRHRSRRKLCGDTR
jgi:hypothetical protein